MSANDPIEELFRENQHGLDEKPRDLIWGRIEERLDEKQLAKKKNDWWKYGAAASILIGLTLGVWAFLFNPDNNSEMTTPQMVLEEPMEVNEENASEILDKLEENKQSVAILEETKSAPDVIENGMENTPEPISLKIPEPMMKPEPVYDIAPMEEISAAPMMESSKKVEEGEVVVFRGENPEKKEGNYVLQSKPKSQKYEKDDTRRLGNMADTSGTYGHENQQNKISIPLKSSLVQYDLVSRTDSSLLFQNEKIAYPNQIILTHANDSVSVIYSGKENKKDSKESQNIQKYIQENKSQIVSDFGLK